MKSLIFFCLVESFLISIFIYISLQYASKKRLIDMLLMLIDNNDKYFVNFSFASNIQSILSSLVPVDIDKSSIPFGIERSLNDSSFRMDVQKIFDSILVLYAVKFEERCTACKEFDDFAKLRKKMYAEGTKFSRELLVIHTKEEKERKKRLEETKRMFWGIHAIVKENGWDTFPSYLDYLILDC